MQLQPLSVPFYGDCLEYGMVVVDISSLEHEQIKYDIVAFPVHYKAVVDYRSESCDWDLVDDDPPSEEPDAELVDEPREPLSILSYLNRYSFFDDSKKDPQVLELDT